MALSYRQIQDEIGFAHVVWKVEKRMPPWFRASGAVWIKNKKAFLKWWKSLPEIYGLFDDDQLSALVYLEFLAARSVNIHVSVIAPMDPADVIRFFASLKQHKYNEGVLRMRGWLLQRNRRLVDIAAQAGFNATGLIMDHGGYRGRVFRWAEFTG